MALYRSFTYSVGSKRLIGTCTAQHCRQQPAQPSVIRYADASIAHLLRAGNRRESHRMLLPLASPEQAGLRNRKAQRSCDSAAASET